MSALEHTTPPDLIGYGGKGVGRRPWKRLERDAAACYEVPTGREG